MNVSIKLPSENFKKLKIFDKQSTQNVIFKRNWANFRIFQKQDICGKTLSSVYVYTMSSRHLEKWPSFGILMVEKGHFLRCILRFLYFLDFQHLSNLSRSKSGVGSFFVFMTEKWPKNMYYATQTHDFQFDPSLTSWPWMTLTLNMLNKSLGWYLEVSQTRSMSLHWLFPFHTALVRDKTRYSKSSNIFTLTWPVTSSVTPRSTTLAFPRQILYIYGTPFEFCKSDQ